MGNNMNSPLVHMTSIMTKCTGWTLKDKINTKLNGIGTESNEEVMYSFHIHVVHVKQNYNINE